MTVKPWIMSLDDPGDIQAQAGTVARARALRLKLRDLLHEHFRSVQYVLEALKAFEREQDYAALEDPQGEPFDSVMAFCSAPTPYGLGWDEADVLALWSETREIALGDFLDERSRAGRAQMLGQTVPALPQHGEIGNGRSRDDNITS